MGYIRRVAGSLRQYGFLIEQLVSRDFKVKYKRSALGVAWSLLYPLLTMAFWRWCFRMSFVFLRPASVTSPIC